LGEGLTVEGGVGDVVPVRVSLTPLLCEGVPVSVAVPVRVAVQVELGVWVFVAVPVVRPDPVCVAVGLNGRLRVAVLVGLNSRLRVAVIVGVAMRERVSDGLVVLVAILLMPHNKNIKRRILTRGLDFQPVRGSGGERGFFGNLPLVRKSGWKLTRIFPVPPRFPGRSPKIKPLLKYRMPSHNPQPFVKITETNANNEIMRFCLLVAEETNKSKALNKPGIFFVKWELPTKEKCEPFLKMLIKCIQIATKAVFKTTLHYSQLTTTETTENQLDLIIGVGIKAEDFKKVLRQVILMTTDKENVGEHRVELPVETKEGEEGESTANTGGITKEDTEVVCEA